ncbi:MAG: GDP-mannose 4,6-dehydratase [Acidimicrobiales bacterium]
MRALVTGGHGFVATWLEAHLAAAGDEVVVSSADVTDPAAIGKVVSSVRPEAVYHLAALSHVGRSWEQPLETFRVNAVGTLNVLEAVRAADTGTGAGSRIRVLLVGSADVYGSVDVSELPLTEESPLRPTSPYAASKVAAEYLGLQAWLGHGVPVIRVRAFNHVGPGQSEAFVVSSLARQIAEVERHGSDVLLVGNTTARRDLTDVRDVVRAYRMLMLTGEPGEVYQVCSGVDVAISELAERLLRLSTRSLRVEIDPARVRAVDVPVLVGDPRRLFARTGWRPEIDLDATLADTLEWWRSRLARDSDAATAGT